MEMPQQLKQQASQIQESEDAQVHYKLLLKNCNFDQVRRISLPKGKKLQWVEFHTLVRKLFQIPAEEETVEKDLLLVNMCVEYKDEEGDMITISSEMEWEEAQWVLEGQSLRRFYLLKKVSSSSSRGQEEKSGETPLDGVHWKRQLCGEGKKKWSRTSLQQQQHISVGEEQKQNPLFQEGSVVHIRSNVSGRNLRVRANGTVDVLGAKGPWAKFTVFPGLHSQETVRLQNVGQPKHWLRIHRDSNLDGKGRGGPLCELKVVFRKASDNNNQSADLGKSDTFSLVSLFDPLVGVGVGENGSAQSVKGSVIETKGLFSVYLASKK